MVRHTLSFSLLSLGISTSTALGQANWQGVPFYYGYGTPDYGPRGAVYDLKSWDPDGATGPKTDVLVIAGSFQLVTRANGTTFTANNICIWDGCDYQPWCDESQSPANRGFSGVVRSLEVYEGTLIAGGDFDTVDGSSANALAFYSGTHWVQLSSGVQQNGVAGIVYDLHVHNDGTNSYLYVGGQFDTAGGSAADSLARWNGAAWSTIGNVRKCASGSTSPGIITSIASEGNDLVVAGDFWAVGGTVAADIAWHSGSTWSRTANVYGIGENISVPPCTPGCPPTARSSVLAVGSDGTYSWAGGDVGAGASGVGRISYDICNLPMSPVSLTGIARSQRLTWTDASGVGAGPKMVDSSQFMMISGSLYAVGDRQAYPPNDPNPTSYPRNVCVWTASAWNGVGDYLNGPVRAIVVYKGDIYIGGDFGGAQTSPGGTERPLGGPIARLTLQCSAADLGKSGGLPGGDGVLDSNDQIAFLNLFFAHCPAADLGVAAGLPGRDGNFDNNDSIAFYNLFFAGCP